MIMFITEPMSPVGLSLGDPTLSSKSSPDEIPVNLNGLTKMTRIKPRELNGVRRITDLPSNRHLPTPPETVETTSPRSEASQISSHISSHTTITRPTITPHRCYATTSLDAIPLQESNWGSVRSLLRAPPNTDTGGRPPFITVVRRGSFLKPPAPQPHQVLLFTYSSRPKVVNTVCRRKRAPIDGEEVSQEKIGERRRQRKRISSRGSQSDSPSEKETPSNNNNNNNNNNNDSTTYHLMYDRRLARGNAFRQSQNSMGDTTVIGNYAQRQQEVRQRVLARRKARMTQNQTPTPPPVSGRKHTDCQTDKFLEELWERSAEAVDAYCQTDPFTDRSTSPCFVPPKSGSDVDTQIYPGELFDFDLEVRPVLESLIGKTINQALLEVLEEEESASLSYQQRRIDEKHRAMLLENERLAELLEGENGISSNLTISQSPCHNERGTRVSRRYFRDLVPIVLNDLQKKGYFTSTSTNEEVKNEVMPLIVTEVETELDIVLQSRKSNDVPINDDEEQLDNDTVETAIPDSVSDSEEAMLSTEDVS